MVRLRVFLQVFNTRTGAMHETSISNNSRMTHNNTASHYYRQGVSQEGSIYWIIDYYHHNNNKNYYYYFNSYCANKHNTPVEGR